jgi:hypothetical protein
VLKLLLVYTGRCGMQLGARVCMQLCKHGWEHAAAGHTSAWSELGAFTIYTARIIESTFQNYCGLLLRA